MHRPVSYLIISLSILLASQEGQGRKSGPCAGDDSVDSFVDAKLKSQGVKAVPLADDGEFLRRLTLDVTGRIPTENEARRFLKSQHRLKRAAAIDRLLPSKDFDRHWGRFLLELFTDERGVSDEENGYAGYILHRYLVESMQNRIPYDKIVTELLTAQGSALQVMPIQFVARYPLDENLVAAVGKKMLGIRIQCAQCHDHPFDKWTQEQFQGFQAFFSQTRRYRGRDRDGIAVLDVKPIHRYRSPADEIPLKDRKVPPKPKYLNGAKPESGKTLRQELARLILDPRSSPTFAPNIVNRVWARLMGRGLVEPLDGFKSTNKASHPKLLAWLAERFRKDGYDLRKLVRNIVSSNTYQRSCHINGKKAPDARLYARMVLKPLTPDQLYQSFLQLTGHDPIAELETEQDRLNHMFYGDMIPLEEFGGAPGTMARALSLINRDIVQGTQAEIVDALFRKHGEDIDLRHFNTVTLMLLSRELTRKELNTYSRILQGDPGEALTDYVWAVLNSVEFSNNH